MTKHRILFLVFLYPLFTFCQPKTSETHSLEFLKNIFKEKNNNYFKIDSLLTGPTNTEFKTKGINLTLLELSIKNDYIIGEIVIRNNIGRILRREGKYQESIRFHKKALELSKTIDQQQIEAFTLNLIGACYRRNDDVRNALNYHQTALAIATKDTTNNINTKKNISISINSIGNIYLSLNQFNLALNQFKKSLKIAKELGNELGLAINYENIGFAQENLLRFDNALKNYQESLKINEKLNSIRGKIICYNNLSSIYRKKGDHKKALSYIKEIYPLALKNSSNYYLARTLNNYGGALLKNNQLNQAETKLKMCLEIARKHNLKKSEITSTGLLADLYFKKKQFYLAYTFHKESVDLERKIIDKKNISYVNNLISKHNAQSKLDEIAFLEKQSEIDALQFYRNRNILIITLITAALLSIALYSIYRQRLLNNDRKVLLLEQQALQAQMNPHFIFNALNSIKLYIINNEQKQAVYYLNKFSKLIRNILDVSKIKEVSLKEELATMELYMSIENIRFSNEINYQVTIDPDLNTDTIKVPPLILQPFLENAIWHGLSSKKNDKQIRLITRKISETLVEVQIIDNGIGRAAAAKIKEAKSLKRKSVGINLTKERLKAFSEDYDDEFSLTYHDLIDKDGAALGTRVALRFPSA